MFNPKKIALLAILIFTAGFFIFQYFKNPEPIRASASDNVSGYAWSDTIGWISFNNTTGGGSAYGVSVNPNGGKLSGYAWSDNIGWISFNEADLTGCPSGTCVAKAASPGQLGKSNVDILGWARALANGGGWDGWIRFNHGQASPVYIDSVGNFHGYAWGSDVVGWISFDHGKPNPVVLNLSGFNQPPNKPGIPNGYPANGVVENNCSIQALYIPTFNWTYSDPDGDLQGGYQIQIDDAVSSSTPILDETVGSASVSYTPTPVWISANLNWGVTYYWRAKVKDILGNWSVWSDYKSFTIPSHAYPWIDFNWLPASPKAKESIKFSSASTTFYGGASGQSWAWDFGDSTATSTTQNPSHSYLADGTYLVKLGVCDNSNYCCIGANAKQKSVQISLPLPEWKEVAPF